MLLKKFTFFKVHKNVTCKWDLNVGLILQILSNCQNLTPYIYIYIYKYLGMRNPKVKIHV